MTKIQAVVARQDDGEIQITFTLPQELIKKTKEEVIEELAKEIEVAGFRKGKSPLAKAAKEIPESKLIETTILKLLPKALTEAIKENKLKLALYPKFELVSAKDGEDWQVRAVSCEIPEIELGDYKEKIKGEFRALSLTKDPSQEEKEQKAIKTLIEVVQVKIPKILIEEEVTSRLTSLLSRLEKLGLALESYLATIGKNPESLRAEYTTQANEAILLDLALSKIANEENLKVEEKEIESALNVSQADKEMPKEDLEERRKVLELILKKRKALEFLKNLA